MRKLSLVLHTIDTLSEWSGKLTSFLIILMMGTVLWIALARKVLHTPAIQVWNYATATRVLFIYVILGAAYVLHRRANVNVDILYSRFSLRVKSIVDAITFIAFLLFCIALLYMALGIAVKDALKFHFSLRSFLPPYWSVTLVAPLGILLFLLQGLAKFIRDLYTAITGRELV